MGGDVTIAPVRWQIVFIAHKSAPSCSIPIIITGVESRRGMQYLRGTLIDVKSMWLFNNEYDLVFKSNHVHQIANHDQHKDLVYQR